MSTELAIVGQEHNALVTAESQGGLGIDFSSSLFQLRPATLSIVQKSNELPDGSFTKPGQFRMTDTGEQYPELTCTLLSVVEKRSYYVGKPGEMNRSPDNLMCFSSQVTRDKFKRETQGPDVRSKVEQAVKCSGCKKASWDTYRQTKDKNDIPPCETYYHVHLIDTTYQMPMQMYLRSTAKAPFEQGMQKLSRRLVMMKSQGKNPSIFDVSFTLRTKKEVKGKYTFYVPDMSEFRDITPEERAAFGEIYGQFIASRTKLDDIETTEGAADVVAESTQSIDNAVTADVGEIHEGEITV
jgi:hypothetical protein